MPTYRSEALARFKANPSKCYQRYIREVEAEHDPRPVLDNLKGCHVRVISNTLAANFIRRYEWLGTMATDTRICFGLWPSKEFAFEDDLLGVVCFTKGSNRRTLETVGPYDQSIILCRGACTMRAGKNAASFLISRACKILRAEHGITHFIAYSDPEAGERGHIYKALGWQCLGPSVQGVKSNFTGPEGQKVSSYMLNKRSYNERWLRRLGWDGEQSKYEFLRAKGFTEHREAKKVRWLLTCH